MSVSATSSIDSERPALATTHAANAGKPAPHLHRVLKAPLEEMLDHVQNELFASEGEQQRVNRAMDHLFLALRSRRQEAPEEWGDAVAYCHSHPVKALIHQDPFTSRAFSKPRGYAGDAELLDYIYGVEEQWPAPDAPPIGRGVFHYTTQAPAAAGVRSRRGFMADLIDRLAVEKNQPTVLSIAAGHLREASLAAAVKRRKLGRLVALDADPISLDEVRRDYGSYGVETVAAHLRRLLTNQLQLGTFDLVYSTGLLDYLAEPAARRLVMMMFDMLRPGGRMVVANFMPGVRDIGYMEAFMDWRLIYRTRYDMVGLTLDVPEEQIREMTLFAEENQNIIFLQITKK